MRSHIILKCLLRWCVGVESQNMAEKGEASLFDFSGDGDFVGNFV